MKESESPLLCLKNLNFYDPTEFLITLIPIAFFGTNLYFRKKMFNAQLCFGFMAYNESGIHLLIVLGIKRDMSHIIRIRTKGKKKAAFKAPGHRTTRDN